LAIPELAHTNDASIFKLARSLKAVEVKLGRPLTDSEQCSAFEAWCLKAEGMLTDSIIEYESNFGEQWAG
jgi:hypothetical protein